MKRIIATMMAASLAGGLSAGAAAAAPAAQNTAPASPAATSGQMASVKAVIEDARLAGMKAMLKLTPDQEKYWGPFETAVRDSYTQRNQMMGETRQAVTQDDPVQLLNKLSDDASRGAAELKKVADAAKPLYDSLTPAQKQAFGPLLLTLRGNPMTAARQAQRVQQLLMQRWAQSESNDGD